MPPDVVPNTKLLDDSANGTCSGNLRRSGGLLSARTFAEGESVTPKPWRQCMLRSANHKVSPLHPSTFPLAMIPLWMLASLCHLRRSNAFILANLVTPSVDLSVSEGTTRSRRAAGAPTVEFGGNGFDQSAHSPWPLFRFFLSESIYARGDATLRMQNPFVRRSEEPRRHPASFDADLDEGVRDVLAGALAPSGESWPCDNDRARWPDDVKRNGYF